MTMETHFSLCHGLKLDYLPFGRWPAPKNPQIGGIIPGVGRPVVPFLLHSKTRKLHSFVVYATHIFFGVFFFWDDFPKCHKKVTVFCESSKTSLVHWFHTKDDQECPKGHMAWPNFTIFHIVPTWGRCGISRALSLCPKLGGKALTIFNLPHCHGFNNHGPEWGSRFSPKLDKKTNRKNIWVAYGTIL
jgi:hypothetical protein